MAQLATASWTITASWEPASFHAHSYFSQLCTCIMMFVSIISFWCWKHWSKRKWKKKMRMTRMTHKRVNCINIGKTLYWVVPAGIALCTSSQTTINCESFLVYVLCKLRLVVMVQAAVRWAMFLVVVCHFDVSILHCLLLFIAYLMLWRYFINNSMLMKQWLVHIYSHDDINYIV